MLIRAHSLGGTSWVASKPAGDVRRWAGGEVRTSLHSRNFHPADAALPFPPAVSHAANPVSINQDIHEEILRSCLHKLSVTVELGTELHSFEQFLDHVIAQIVETGADARSVVRKQLGLTFLGETKTEEHIALGDTVVEEGLGRGYWHYWIPPQSVVCDTGTATRSGFNHDHIDLALKMSRGRQRSQASKGSRSRNSSRLHRRNRRSSGRLGRRSRSSSRHRSHSYSRRRHNASTPAPLTPASAQPTPAEWKHHAQVRARRVRPVHSPTANFSMAQQQQQQQQQDERALWGPGTTFVPFSPNPIHAQHPKPYAVAELRGQGRDSYSSAPLLLPHLSRACALGFFPVLQPAVLQTPASGEKSTFQVNPATRNSSRNVNASARWCGRQWSTGADARLAHTPHACPPAPSLIAPTHPLTRITPSMPNIPHTQSAPSTPNRLHTRFTPSTHALSARHHPRLHNPPALTLLAALHLLHPHHAASLVSARRHPTFACSHPP
ncbi:hypothetical protein B0H10DRAFT_2215443 [Mycena sp. CBHHK59/15]|nr:hypothetical protein B0H10DRAFT_2215443 [Mycena sp. CBHHK59/15]